MYRPAWVFWLAGALVSTWTVAAPSGSAITYQGRLDVSGAPATGLFDLQLCLFDSLVGGAELVCAADLDDIPVEDGIFTVDADFGATAFTGEARFLELRVRDGASAPNMPYTILLPRQAIRPAPQALLSAATPWSGLTAVPPGFADGVDDAGVTSVAAGFGLEEGTVTSTGSLSVDPQVIQRRVSGQCAAGSTMVRVNEDGTVQCSANGSGTVTSVGSGTGLTGGPITGSGTLAVDTAAIQRRVLGTCTAGAAVTAVNADGTVQCGAPGAGTVTSVASGMGLTGGPITSSGTLAVDTATIQRRVAGTCTPGAAVAAVNSDGTVQCNPVGSGTVTSVGTGVGLTGGPITADGVLAVDTTAIQQRVSGTCAVGSAVRVVNADGTVQCATIGAGTVTSVASGAGLTGGPITGTGTLAVDTSFVQRRVSGGCGVAAISQINADGTVQCSSAGSGTVTSITAGSGLTGGTITTAGTLAVNPALVQSRVSGTCAVGSTIRAVNQDGTVTCDPHGSVTSVGAGFGLTGGPITTSGSLAIDSQVTQRRVTGSCSAGTAVVSIAQDGTVQCGPSGSGTVSSVSTGLGLTGGPITGSGTISIDPAVAQRRINGQCAEGHAVSAVQQDGTPVCVPTGTGTVTSVSAGTGLTGGPITSSGTLSIANGGVGLAQINTAQVQARISGMCAIGEYFRGVAADGSIACEPVPGIPRYSAVDTTNDVGRFASLAIGTDGFPVISYYDATAKALKVAKCTDTACAGPRTITVVDDPANDVGQYSSIVVRSNGLPIISYFDATAHLLYVASCTTPSCSASQRTLVDSSGNAVGMYSAIDVGGDGLPGIAYYDETFSALKFAKCADSNCSTSSKAYVEDTINSVGRNVALVIGKDSASRPRFSYVDSTANDLKYASCSTPSCLGGSVTRVLADSGAFVSQGTAIVELKGDLVSGAVGIVYSDTFDHEVWFVRCNSTCSAPALLMAQANGTPSLEVPDDGLPVFSLYDQLTSALLVGKCQYQTCETGVSRTTLDANGIAGIDASLAIGLDGLPLVAYYRTSDLMVAKCGNRTCQ